MDLEVTDDEAANLAKIDDQEWMDLLEDHHRAEIAISIPALLRDRETMLEEIRRLNGGSQWISVEERLPEEGSRVLVWDSSLRGSYQVSVYQRFWVRGHQSSIPKEVTHWMPLPAPPITP